jgi:phosphoglycolate phosphatase
MHLFFDLDGTLTDSAPGIVRCLNHALAAVGYPEQPEDRVRAFIGTPLVTIFREIAHVDDDAVLDRAVDAYRDRFEAAGMFENALYPGVEAALEALSRTGHTLQVVTVKPAWIARRVVSHFGIEGLFREVHGASPSERGCDKAALVGAALTLVGGDAASAAMIGDRAADVLAARRHGVAAIAAAWGYGSREELTAAGPSSVAATLDDVLEWVRRRTGETGTPVPSVMADLP